MFRVQKATYHTGHGHDRHSQPPAAAVGGVQCRRQIQTGVDHIVPKNRHELLVHAAVDAVELGNEAVLHVVHHCLCTQHEGSHGENLGEAAKPRVVLHENQRQEHEQLETLHSICKGGMLYV